VGDTGGKTTQKIEQKVPESTHPIFHIIPKDIKGPHITKEMKEAPMKEHEGYKGEELLARGKV
jgi:hypothetical protein